MLQNSRMMFFFPFRTRNQLFYCILAPKSATTDLFVSDFLLTSCLMRDYHATWKTVSNKLKNHPDYEEYINLEGTRKARNTFSKHIEQLKQEHIRKRREEYINTLPRAFNTLLPNLEEIEHLNWSEALKLMEKRADFQLCLS